MPVLTDAAAICPIVLFGFGFGTPAQACLRAATCFPSSLISSERMASESISPPPRRNRKRSRQEILPEQPSVSATVPASPTPLPELLPGWDDYEIDVDSADIGEESIHEPGFEPSRLLLCLRPYNVPTILRPCSVRNLAQDETDMLASVLDLEAPLPSCGQDLSD